jgi:hypothetical protein
VEDKAKGRMKEAAGAVTGDEHKKAEGQAQQRKGAAGEEAAQKAKQGRPRRMPEKPRGSETSSVARTREGSWATWETLSQDARETSPTLPRAGAPPKFRAPALACLSYR